ncbi:PDR/VanB family oxidoreductase [Zoogloeaceae bacterium G21618-S1]|nr:PDR/VanB family oxidoreductase [Zoogloeaceae bacterium G21618-S1]
MNQSPGLHVRVARRTQLAEDIIGLSLAPVADTPLPPVTAGAHIDLTLPNGLVRQYSLASTDLREGYQIGILLDPTSRGGSASAHRDIAVGDTIRISAPRNHFPLVEGARQSLLFAGGIGITPMISMADTLDATGADFTLHYCVRSAGRAAFRERLRQAPYATKTHFHIDDRADSPPLDARAALAHPTADTHLYVCGPNGFLDHIISTARDMGWAETNIHFERFSAPPTTAVDDGSFELALAKSARTVHVNAGQSAAQALFAAGIALPMSCEQGLCGTCLTTVLDGEPDHRDMFLTDAEKAANTCFTPCCSRARSARLVIDL